MLALKPGAHTLSTQRRTLRPVAVFTSRPLRSGRPGGSVVPVCAGVPRGDRTVSSQRKTNEEVMTIRNTVKAKLDQLIADLGSKSTSSAGSDSSSSSSAADVARLRAKLQNAIAVMQEGLVERDTEVRLLLLAAMAGEHILLIGPPGTAKSEVGRRLNKLVEGKYFERLLTRFSVPEELFGPLSMRALEDDKYVRQTQGYLPEAEVAFIDEIFKANSAILNTLLTLINERLFDNGQQRQRVPLVSVVGASNELPESEELDALYDRFLVRRQVSQVTPSGVAQMLQYYSSEEAASNGSNGSDSNDGNGNNNTPSSAPSSSMPTPAAGARLTLEEIRRCKSEALKRVRVPHSVIQLVTDLRSYLQEKIEPPVYVSDRRLVKAIQLLQVAAYCNGRESVTEYDLLLLQHVLWQKPEQADRINDWVMGQLSVDDGLKQVTFLMSGLFSRACRALSRPQEVASILNEVQQVHDLLADKYTQVAGSLGGGFPIVLDNLWLGTDEAQAVATALGPKLSKTRAAVETMLYDVLMLEIALSRNADPVTLANLMPKYWADFIRNSDISEVKPIGTIPLRP